MHGATIKVCIYLLQTFQTGNETHTESIRMRTGGPFQGVKRSGHDFRSLFLEGKNDSEVLLYSQYKKKVAGFTNIPHLLMFHLQFAELKC